MSSNKLTGFPSQQMKNQINNLVQVREGIDRGKNISDSMIKLNSTLGNIEPLLKNQGNYIKNFFNQQNTGGAKEKQSQARRYLNRIVEITTQQINALLDACQDYFKIDFKNSWNKISSQFQKQFQTIRDETDHKNIVQFMFKIINLKDYLTNQFFRSLIYRKCLLFKDLNIIQHGFVHAQKKAITKKIEEYMGDRGYVPTKPIFQWCGFQVQGDWNMNKLVQNKDASMKDLLKIANEQIQAIFDVIRNYSNLTSQQRQNQDIKRNDENIKSLRQQIEESKFAYAQLQKKYRQAAVRDQKASDSLQFREKLIKMEEIMEEKDNELKILKFQFRDSSNQINSLREKVKQLESDINRISNVEMKKLKELQMVQNNLSEEFNKIYKNTSNFGAMFEFQSHGKKSLAKQIMAKQKTIQSLVTILGREKNKIKQQQIQITRLNTIILELGDKIDRSKSSIEN